MLQTNDQRNEILSNCADEDERRRTEELIRPILRGRDISRYGYNWANLWLIATFPARKYDIEQFPAVKSYLLSFAEPILRDAGFSWVAENHLADYCCQKLSQTGRYIEISGQRIRLGTEDKKARKKTLNKWFETQDSISYWDDFSKPKIVWGNLNLKASYTLIGDYFYINAPAAMIIPYYPIILAVLNSIIGDFYIRLLGVTRNGGYFEYKPMFIDRLPVPKLQEQSSLNETLQSMIESFSHEKIERTLFKIYDLNDEEIDYLLGSKL